MRVRSEKQVMMSKELRAVEESFKETRRRIARIEKKALARIKAGKTRPPSGVKPKPIKRWKFPDFEEPPFFKWLKKAAAATVKKRKAVETRRKAAALRRRKTKRPGKQ